MIQGIIWREPSTTGRFMEKDKVEKIVNVSDFTIVPGARYRKDGDSSAEAFFEDKLKPVLDVALSSKECVLIDFDGTWGYASSFISELARRVSLNYDKGSIQQYLRLKSNDEPTLIDRFQNELAKDYDGQSQSS